MAQGIVEYRESLNKMRTSKAGARDLNKLIKDPNAPLTDETLAPIADKSGLDYNKIKANVANKKKSPTIFDLAGKVINAGIGTIDTINQTKDTIAAGKRIFSNEKNSNDAFGDTKGGLGTFSDLEKLLKTAGGFMGAISLLSKFFKLDLMQVENLNDTSNTTINQIVPGTTPELLNNKIPDRVNIPKFPKIETPDPMREGSELANNLGAGLNGQFTQSSIEVINFGTTENVPTPEISAPPIELETPPEYNNMEIPNSPLLDKLQIVSLELPNVPGSTSKIEGSVQFNSNNYLSNVNIILKNMAITLNLKLDGNSLNGGGTLTLGAFDNIRNTLYNGNTNLLPFQIRADSSIIGSITFTISQTPSNFSAETYITFITVNSGNSVSYINKTDKTVSMYIYAPKLGMTENNPLKIEGNYEE